MKNYLIIFIIVICLKIKAQTNIDYSCFKVLNDSITQILNNQDSTVFISYYSNERMKILAKKNMSGQKNGFYFKFYENGKLKVDGNYYKGKKNGDFGYYNSKGHYMYYIEYKNGKRIKKMGFPHSTHK